MSNVTIVMPVYGEDQNIGEVYESIQKQTHRDWTLIVVDQTSDCKAMSFCEKAYARKEPIRYESKPYKNAAAMLNGALNSCGSGLLLPLPPHVILKPDALKKFVAAFDKDPEVAAAYSDYEEKKLTGEIETHKLYYYPNVTHERWEYGYVKVYNADIIRKLGGWRSSLVYMSDYALQLKIYDHHLFAHVAEPLYLCVEQPPTKADKEEQAKMTKLHSPGSGHLGGFSYLFYPPKMEEEVVSVFEDCLRRRGAFLSHKSVKVPYPPDKQYEVMCSVVIPVLNRVKFIGNAIQKVIDGKYQDFEVVVVDNGSKDGTQDIVRQFEAKDPRIRLIQHNGHCIADALNTGIRAARGKYICQLDSDDEYTPETLQFVADHMESHPNCGLSISYYELMDEAGTPLPEFGVIKHLEFTRNNILRVDGAGALRVFPKVVLEEFGLYDEKNYGNFGEDYDMVLKVSEKYDVDRLHAVLYRYRRHPDNTDVTRDPMLKINNKNNARVAALERRRNLNRKLARARG
ncbi:MAG: glycosyltransferase [bacterium]